MSSNSKFLFALIIIAVTVGWIYGLFNPNHTIENNLELNSNYYTSVTENKNYDIYVDTVIKTEINVSTPAAEGSLVDSSTTSIENQ